MSNEDMLRLIQALLILIELLQKNSSTVEMREAVFALKQTAQTLDHLL